MPTSCLPCTLFASTTPRQLTLRAWTKGPKDLYLLSSCFSSVQGTSGVLSSSSGPVTGSSTQWWQKARRHSSEAAGWVPKALGQGKPKVSSWVPGHVWLARCMADILAAWLCKARGSPPFISTPQLPLVAAHFQVAVIHLEGGIVQGPVTGPPPATGQQVSEWLQPGICSSTVTTGTGSGQQCTSWCKQWCHCETNTCMPQASGALHVSLCTQPGPCITPVHTHSNSSMLLRCQQSWGGWVRRWMCVQWSYGSTALEAAHLDLIHCTGR